MRLVYLPSADDDILDIFVTIALDNEAAADRFVDRLQTAIMRLADYPESAPARDDIAPGMRGLVCGRYVALYWIADGTVQIVRVLHAMRDLPTVVGERDDSV
jgi:toxin ParE1/3/4